MKTRRRIITISAIVLVLIVMIGLLAPKLVCQSEPADGNACASQVSPQGSYRVDICKPAPPYFSLSQEMPRCVRFFDQRTQKILGKSDIVDMAGRGEVFWPTAERRSILVGGGDNAPEIRVEKLDGQ